MGCASSSDKKASPPAQAPATLLTTAPVDGKLLPARVPHAAPARRGKGKGKGTGKGNPSKWQVQLSGQWKDYGNAEDSVMKRAYMTGQKKCRFQLRGQQYEYDFKRMVQINKDTKKYRQIRQPYAGPKPPAKAVLPTGPMTIICVKPGQAGTVITIPDPNNPGRTIPVFVPPHAKAGAKLAVPLPAKGEPLEKVQEKQEKHDKENGTRTSKSSWSTGGKVAAGATVAAGVAAVGVGGVILGDHLAGGEMASTIGEGVVDAGETIADAAGDAADAIGDWAPGAVEDVGDWVAGAAEDAGEWMVDAGDWFACAAEDAGDWLGDAAEDTGGFIMDLF